MAHIRSILASLLVGFGPACADEPINFPLGIPAGSEFEHVLNLQGWYDCSGEKPNEALCFDDVMALGVRGTYQIDFIDRRAYSAQLNSHGLSGDFETILGQLKHLGDFSPFIIELVTENTTIDVYQAVHELGPQEAYRRFGHYLETNSRKLHGITMVGLPTNANEITATRAVDIISSLPSGAALLTLVRGNGPIGSVSFKMEMAPIDRDHYFPQYERILEQEPTQNPCEPLRDLQQFMCRERLRALGQECEHLIGIEKLICIRLRDH